MMANYNITFDWQIYNFLLKASVQTLLANKEIKTKSGIKFCLEIISKLKGFEFYNFYSILHYVDKPPAEELHRVQGTIPCNSMSTTVAIVFHTQSKSRIWQYLPLKMKVDIDVHFYEIGHRSASICVIPTFKRPIYTHMNVCVSLYLSVMDKRRLTCSPDGIPCLGETHFLDSRWAMVEHYLRENNTMNGFTSQL